MRVLRVCGLIGFLMIGNLSLGATDMSTSGVSTSDEEVARSTESIVPARMLPESDMRKVCPYPAEAQKAHEEGVTKLRIATDATGVLTSASVHVSSGSARLDSAALECVKKARFAPATRNGEPISSMGGVTWKWKYVPMPLQTCDQPSGAADPAALPGVIGTLTLKLDPEVARRAPGGGRAVICVCLDESGKLARDPVISLSSGNAFLDSGAIKTARAIPYQAGSHGCMRATLVFVE